MVRFLRDYHLARVMFFIPLSLEFDMLLMQLLQVNMMKILLIMDISIMLCLFYACLKRYNNFTDSVRI